VLAHTEQKHAEWPIDRCNDDCCQRYHGTSYLTPRASEAVLATRGQVLLDAAGQIIDANYSKSCGGVIEAPEHVWFRSKSCLVAALDAPADSEAGAFMPVTEANLDAFLSGDWLNRADVFCSPTVVPDADLPQYRGRWMRGRAFRWCVEYAESELRDVLAQAAGVFSARRGAAAAGRCGRDCPRVVQAGGPIAAFTTGVVGRGPSGEPRASRSTTPTGGAWCSPFAASTHREALPEVCSVARSSWIERDGRGRSRPFAAGEAGGTGSLCQLEPGWPLKAMPAARSCALLRGRGSSPSDEHARHVRCGSPRSGPAESPRDRQVDVPELAAIEPITGPRSARSRSDDAYSVAVAACSVSESLALCRCHVFMTHRSHPFPRGYALPRGRTRTDGGEANSRIARTRKYDSLCVQARQLRITEFAGGLRACTALEAALGDERDVWKTILHLDISGCAARAGNGESQARGRGRPGLDRHPVRVLRGVHARLSERRGGTARGALRGAPSRSRCIGRGERQAACFGAG